MSATETSGPSLPLVRCDIRGATATVTLDSGVTRNTLSEPLLEDLHTALDRAESADIRIIILTNTGGTFCAGADLRERLAGPVDSTTMVDAFRRLSETHQVTIAAVKGHVRAGGIGLMASCDLVVVPMTTSFAFTEVLIGVAPAIISVPILRRCSPSAMAAAFLTGEQFDGEHARRIGLVTHVTDDVDAEVAALCARILMGAPRALAVTKQILRDPSLHGSFTAMQALSDELFGSEEAHEGMHAFLDKRPPNWTMPPG